MRYKLHPMNQILFLIREVDGAVVTRILKLQPSDPACSAHAELLIGKRRLELLQRISHRRNAEIGEIRIQPDHFVIRKADMLREMLDVLLGKHISEDELSRFFQHPEHPGPIELRIFDAAGCPADAEIEIVDHRASPYGNRIICFPSDPCPISARKKLRAMFSIIVCSIFSKEWYASRLYSKIGFLWAVPREVIAYCSCCR